MSTPAPTKVVSFRPKLARSGGYIANNFWNNDAGDTHKIMNVKGGNENLITSHNNFASTQGKDWNLQQGSAGDTLVQDQCAGGGFSIDTAGTNQRTKAAASSACYTTLP